MSETLDRARREIAELRKIINAQQSGIPPRLGVIVFSDNATHIEEAVKAKLGVYGLSSREEAKAAGCDVDVMCLPWCKGRAVDKTSPEQLEFLRNAGKGGNDDLSVGSSVGKDIESAESHSDQGTRTDTRSAYSQKVDQ